MHYFRFGFDLDPAILAPLHSSNWEKFPFLFSCLSWYLLSRRIVLALLTQSFSVQSLLFLPSLSFSSLFIISSRHPCFEFCLSHNVHIFSHYFSLFVFYLNPAPSSLFFSSFEGNNYNFSCLCFLSFLIFIIYLSSFFFLLVLVLLFFYFSLIIFLLNFLCIIYIIYCILIFSIYHIYFSLSNLCF